MSDKSIIVMIRDGFVGDFWKLPFDTIVTSDVRARFQEDTLASFQADLYQGEFATLSPPPSKVWGAGLWLEGTPHVFDLADLPLDDGTLSFTAIRLAVLTSFAERGSGMKVKVGGEGSGAEWHAPFGRAGDSLLLYPLCQAIFASEEPSGLAVDTGHLLQLDPGSDSIFFTLALAGD